MKTQDYNHFIISMLPIASSRCQVPNITNAYILDDKTYYNKAIQVFCNDGYIFHDRQQHWTVCILDANTGETKWPSLSAIKCIAKSCNPHPDFNLPRVRLEKRKETYDLGEVVEYTCPGEYKITTTCILNETNGFGEWDFNGSCKGIGNLYLSIAISMHVDFYSATSSDLLSHYLTIPDITAGIQQRLQVHSALHSVSFTGRNTLPW